MRGWRWMIMAVVGTLCIAGGARAENMSIGIGPTSHFYLLDGRPELSTGIGGHVYFDYRWAPQVSTQFTVAVTTQNGKNSSAGDNNILFFAIPAVDFKFFFLKSSGRIDPYGGLGVGFYLLSEGSNGANGTLAMGLGASATVGVDVFFTPQLSGNLRGTFHSIGMLGSLSGNNNGAGLFPVTAQGSLAFHF